MNADYGKWEVLLFQFYDSPIKSNGNFPLFRYILGFNSMIVRLKAVNHMPERFQFYDSPIKSGFSCIAARAVMGFNSMIVRLKE